MLLALAGGHLLEKAITGGIVTSTVPGDDVRLSIDCRAVSSKLPWLFLTHVVQWFRQATPRIVAYCRMEMVLSGMGQVADELLSTYEAAVGKRVVNLGFWELAACARPMFSPDGWITPSPAKEHFRQFVADARKRTGF